MTSILIGRGGDIRDVQTQKKGHVHPDRQEGSHMQPRERSLRSNKIRQSFDPRPAASRTVRKLTSFKINFF